MTSLPPRPPGTPARAASEDPSPLPRNPMADADSSVKRKRPRLDSGERVHRSMSADPSLPPPAVAAGSAAADDNDLSTSHTDIADLDTYSTLTSSAKASSQPLDGTPSQVTINVRDSRMAASPTQQDHAKPGLMSQGDASPTLARMKLSDEPDPSSEAIAVGSTSSEGSPPMIEVAEPEDISGHSGPTVWHTAGTTTEVGPADLDMVMDQFPYLGSQTNVLTGMEHAAHRLQNLDINEPLLTYLSDWMDKCHLCMRPQVSDWNVLCNDWNIICNKYKECWDLLPQVVESLSYRRLRERVDYDFLYADGVSGNTPDTPAPLQRFLVSYAVLTAKMADADMHLLDDAAEDPAFDEIDLLSQGYLRAMKSVISPQAQFCVAQERFAWPIGRVLASAVSTCISHLKFGVQSLTHQVRFLMDRVPLDIEAIANIADLLKYFVIVFAKEHASDESSSALQGEDYVKEILSFFEQIDAKLQDMIIKQTSALNLESLKTIIEVLHALLYHVYLSFGQSLDSTSIVPPRYAPTFLELYPMDQTLFVVSVWKMQLLKKCIMQGRMDSRALGAELMSEYLVEMFNRYLKPRDSDLNHPIPVFLADFIQENKLVEYLVGVDSHTQLVPRSKNIVGFLVVSHRYSDKETDIIWNSILESQDPRRTEAIINMVSNILELFKLPQRLIYWCRMLDMLPSKSFQHHNIQNLSRALTWYTYRLALDTSSETDRPPPRHSLYIRLVREAFVEPDLTPEKKKEILGFAVQELGQLLPKVESSETITIYKQCVEYISQGSPYASGSYTIMHHLLDIAHRQERIKQDLSTLESMFQFTREVVKEFSRLREVEKTCCMTIREFNEILTDRLRVLQRIILVYPGYITPDLTASLWSSLIGENALDNDGGRDIAWLFFSQSIDHCKGQENTFIDQLLYEHFPRLDSCSFTASVFQFAKAGTEFAQHSATKSIGNDGIRAGELFWPISLKSKDPELASKAVDNLVEIQLKWQEDLGQGTEEVMKSHASFVARAIQQLIAASNELQHISDDNSSSDEDAMVIITTGAEVSASRLRFLRSLMILQRFVQRTRSHRSFSPDLSVRSPGSCDGINGDEIVVRYQPHIGGKASHVHSLRIGNLSTFGELLDQFRSATGFTIFNIFAHGQKVDQDFHRSEPLRDMALFQREGLLILQKQPGLKTDKVYKKSHGFNRVEIEVMKHFHVLYDLLGLDEELSEGVFRFLTIFPPHDDIAELVYDPSKDVGIVFPSQSIYKAMYSIHALQGVMDQHLSEGAAPPELLSQAVKVLVKALIALDLSSSSTFTQTETTLAKSYVECLLKVLRERVSAAVSKTYFDQPGVFVNQLRRLINKASQNPSTGQTLLLVESCFSLMLEASTHSDHAWASFKDQCFSKDLLRALLLDSKSLSIRISTKSSILSFLAALPSFYSLSQHTGEGFFWSTMASLIPIASTFDGNTEQFFSCAHQMFMTLSDSVRTELPLATYVSEWSKLLIEHQHYELLGPATVDFVANGLAGLLEWGIKLMRSEKRPLELPESLARDIFDHHLFPEVTFDESTQTVFGSVPILDSKTRQYLYSILLSSANDMPAYVSLLDTIRDVLPADLPHALASGVAQPLGDSGYNFLSTWDIDRNQIIRSETGYSGLRNLQNTCYMNSLLTQLFMNVKFRDFLLQLNVSDGLGSQKLLSETQRLLAYMRKTWLKSVDPENVTEVIVTYEGTPIDVSIQMDVDEFYNLLFDRWESQILASDDKKKFRSFYGGEIVQQIKSRDCPHISERIESFSAIQCDIQGKQTLTESLRAYVGGEIMEGDNKYSCSTCGSYVNAVKRACFKSLPDNLILHLKRFDYDLMNGTRRKINERFEFPEQIDMAPYHIDHLQEPEKPPKTDFFTLVGILVHTGSAEAGHYYSYIRERPCISDRWLEFNDSDVSYYNPSNTDNLCFGGWAETWNHQMAFPKPYNAYMLFYERTNVLQAEKLAHVQDLVLPSSKISIPRELQSRIELENREFFRLYGLLDPEHAKFVRAIVEKYLQLSRDTCSEDHELENTLIDFTLNHLHTILARQKDCKELQTVLDLVAKLSVRCTKCCIAFHSWLVTHHIESKALLMKCPIDIVRKKLPDILVQSLKYLREHGPQHYGFKPESPASDSDSEVDIEHFGSIFNIANLLHGMLPYLAVNHRCWDSFYGLLAQIASIGPQECSVLCKYGFLIHCLEICAVSKQRNLAKTWTHHQSFARQLERRRFSYTNFAGFIDLILQKADFPLSFTDSIRPELLPSSRRSFFTLTDNEAQMILWTEDRGPRSVNGFLDEILLLAGDNILACRNIVQTLVRQFPEGIHNQQIFWTIGRHRKLSHSSAYRPFLQAALAYCEGCTAKIQIYEMFIASIRKMEFHENLGPEFVEFFRSFRNLSNERLGTETPKYVQELVLENVMHFGPPLLFSRDPKARKSMFSLLNVICPEDSSEDSIFSLGELRAARRNVAIACLKLVERTIESREPVNEHKVIEAESVLREFQRNLNNSIYNSEEGLEESFVLMIGTRIRDALEGLEALVMSSPEEPGSNVDFESDDFTDATDLL